MFYILLAFLLRTVWAVVPDSITNIDTLSLPDLLDVRDIHDLKTWTPYNNVKLDTGRLLFGKVGGAVWSDASVPTVDDEWTIEFVFRSSGVGKDLIFSETNGLSLFLAQQPNLDDFTNFGGPGRFDGFQFLMNNKGKQGLKIFANDGTKRIENEMNEIIGNCEFSYLNSQVPFSLRVSYSDRKQILKVQLDNNLCFRTDKIKIPKGKYNLGITGDISPASEEAFEVLRLNYWGYLTGDALDDHGLMSDGELKVNVKKIVEVKSEEKEQKSEPEFHSPSAIRESLMERTRKHREEHDRKQREAEAQTETETVGVSNEMKEYFAELLSTSDGINKKLDNLEQEIRYLKAERSVADKAGVDTASFGELRDSLTKQYGDLLDSVSKLNQKVIGEVREQQFTIEELGKKVDLLMSNHKELTYQSTQTPVNTHEGTGNVIRLILMVITIVLVVLAVGFYRLRHDVKHSKLL